MMSSADSVNPFNNFNGSLLLVGEGDFSFTVSLVKILNESSQNFSIISTSLLTGQQIALHSNAEKNIKTILETHDCYVIHGVDARCLQSDHRINDQLFDRIIFNFPHVGGKSNIKQNRRLLKDFFMCAGTLLSKGGDVIVTLCQGQGGTNLDSVSRLWENSWQITAMASYADLILSNVCPFIASDFPEYTSTGFRSQDKAFVSSQAISHIFQHQPTIAYPDAAYLRHDGPKFAEFVDEICHKLANFSESYRNFTIKKIVTPEVAMVDSISVCRVIQHSPINCVSSWFHREVWCPVASDLCIADLLNHLHLSHYTVCKNFSPSFMDSAWCYNLISDANLKCSLAIVVDYKLEMTGSHHKLIPIMFGSIGGNANTSVDTFCIVNVDLLALYLKIVPDIQLLCLQDLSPCLVCPLVWKHDISFWVYPSKLPENCHQLTDSFLCNFDEHFCYRKIDVNALAKTMNVSLVIELLLINVCLNVAAIYLKELTCIDEYSDDDMRTSFCFRMTFSSSRYALSHNKANCLQSIIRLELHKFEFIQLR